MTAASPDDKIIGIHSRGAVRRDAANPMLVSIRTQALTKLGGMVADLLEKADDTLFDFVQRADGTLTNQDYFDAMRELRKQRTVIEERYREHLTSAFLALERGNPLEVDLERSLSESQELSLVSEEQLEERLGTSMIASALLRQFTPVLNQLNYRLGIVAGVDNLDEKANPIAPSHVAYAFRHAMQPCDLSIRVKVLLFKLYEREMGHGLGSFYNDANRGLIEAGIAPEIKPAYVRPSRRTAAARPAADPEGSPELPEGEPFYEGSAAPNWQGAAPAHGRAGYRSPPGPEPRYVPTPETPAEQSVFASLHELLSGYRRMQARISDLSESMEQGYPGPAPANAPALTGHEVLSVLSLFQDEMPDGLKAAVGDPSISITQHLKRELAEGARRLGMNPAARMAATDEDSVDLVGMLFDVMLDERDFDSRARQLIGRLIVPFIKVAMLDRRMFLQKTHPARRLLNSLAEACEGNAGKAPQERELLGQVESTIDRLVAEFNEDIAIFETLEQEFREFIEQHRRRAALAEKRTAEAQRGKERLEHARGSALEDLSDLLERHADLPPAIESFLRRYWTHHLTLCSLRDGDDAAGKYSEAVAVGHDLAELSLLADGRDRYEGLRAMTPRIEPILVSAGCVGSAGADVMVSLQRALGSAEGATQEDRSAAVEAVAALERNAPPVDIAVPEPEAEAEPEEPDPARDLDYEEKDAERIRKLEIGTWIQFVEEDGTAVPAKLSWVSPISNRMLFVNRRGLRYCVASPEELAAMMQQERLNIRPNDAAFEHAMSQVLGKLRASQA